MWTTLQAAHWLLLRNYTKNVAEMWAVCSLLWDTVYMMLFFCDSSQKTECEWMNEWMNEKGLGEDGSQPHCQICALLIEPDVTGLNLGDCQKNAEWLRERASRVF